MQNAHSEEGQEGDGTSGRELSQEWPGVNKGIGPR